MGNDRVVINLSPGPMVLSFFLGGRDIRAQLMERKAKPLRAWKKAHGLTIELGPGFVGLQAYAMQAQLRAWAYGLGPRPIPALVRTNSSAVLSDQCCYFLLVPG